MQKHNKPIPINNSLKSKTDHDLVFNQLATVDLEELIYQLEKDLEMSGNKFVFNKKTPDELVVELKKILEKIDGLGSMQSLLNRIDLNIQKLAIGEDFYFSLSQFIWHRILQKVWIRKNYDPSKK